MEELAINGGIPTREDMLPYGRQSIDKKDVDEVVKTLKSDYLTTGPKVNEFETKIADFCGAKYAVAFSSGTAALHGAAYAAGFRLGDEVITSPITFAATANCLLYNYTVPVFVDVDIDTFNLSYKKVKEFIKDNYIYKKNTLINKKTGRRLKGIIPVHYSGHPVKTHKFHKLAKKYNLKIIEDAAHAIGSFYYDGLDWIKTGSCRYSDMSIFSFHPVKHLTTAEGGMVTTNSRRLYNILMMFRTHGITRNPDIMKKNPGPWYYEMRTLGYNYRMPDINAALGISQFTKLNTFIKKRNAIAAKYLQELSQIKEIILPNEKKWARSSWHIFVIRLRKKYLKTSRNKIFKALKAENIGVNVHYIPVYKHPFYQKNDVSICGPMDNTERIFEGIVTLPIFPDMTENDIGDVIKALKKVLSHYSKIQ